VVYIFLIKTLAQILILTYPRNVQRDLNTKV